MRKHRARPEPGPALAAAVALITEHARHTGQDRPTEGATFEAIAIATGMRIESVKAPADPANPRAVWTLWIQGKPVEVTGRELFDRTDLTTKTLEACKVAPMVSGNVEWYAVASNLCAVAV